MVGRGFFFLRIFVGFGFLVLFLFWGCYGFLMGECLMIFFFLIVKELCTVVFKLSIFVFRVFFFIEIRMELFLIMILCMMGMVFFLLMLVFL